MASPHVDLPPIYLVDGDLSQAFCSRRAARLWAAFGDQALLRETYRKRVGKRARARVAMADDAIRHAFAAAQAVGHTVQISPAERILGLAELIRAGRTFHLE